MVWLDESNGLSYSAEIGEDNPLKPFRPPRAPTASRWAARWTEDALRDGFDLCEWKVRESVTAERDAKRRGYVPMTRHSGAPIGAPYFVLFA